MSSKNRCLTFHIGVLAYFELVDDFTKNIQPGIKNDTQETRSLDLNIDEYPGISNVKIVQNCLTASWIKPFEVEQKSEKEESSNVRSMIRVAPKKYLTAYLVRPTETNKLGLEEIHLEFPYEETDKKRLKISDLTRHRKVDFIWLQNSSSKTGDVSWIVSWIGEYSLSKTPIMIYDFYDNTGKYIKTSSFHWAEFTKNKLISILDGRAVLVQLGVATDDGKGYFETEIMIYQDPLEKVFNL